MFQPRHWIWIGVLWIYYIIFAQPVSVEDIVRQSEDAIRGKTSHAVLEMKIITPYFTRTLKLESWWAGTEKAMIIVRAPHKEAGNKTLKIGNELWNYLRNTETVIKLPPSMLLQSWNGSDFTNDDLVRESSLVKDYQLTLLGEDVIDGVPCWKIEGIPRPEATVVWGKIIYWVRKVDNLPARVEYYDENSNLIRHLEYKAFKRMGKRKIPTFWVMVNDAKPGRRTEIQILDIQFDIKIPSRIFSLRELEKGR